LPKPDFPITKKIDEIEKALPKPDFPITKRIDEIEKINQIVATAHI